MGKNIVAQYLIGLNGFVEVRRAIGGLPLNKNR